MVHNRNGVSDLFGAEDVVGGHENGFALVTQALKQLGSVNGVLNALKGPSQPEQLRLSIIMEDAAWCNPMLPYIVGTCPALGIDYKGVQKCASNADDLAHCDQERYARFFHLMLDRGVAFAPSYCEAAFVSTAHTDEDIGITVEAAGAAFAQL